MYQNASSQAGDTDISHPPGTSTFSSQNKPKLGPDCLSRPPNFLSTGGFVHRDEKVSFNWVFLETGCFNQDKNFPLF
jgi:hypothetical protein